MSEIASIVVIGTSTGGVDALKKLVSALPADIPAAIFIVLHVGGHYSSMPEILTSCTGLPVRHARNQEAIRSGTILIAPPDYHLVLEKTQVRLKYGAKENYCRPAIDPLFRSAATHHGERVIGVILTGSLDDGTVGLQAVKAHGGRTIVQDPSDALAPEMPASAAHYVSPDACLPLATLGAELVAMIKQPLPVTKQTHGWLAEALAREEHFANTSNGGIEELEQFARPSTFTCPECHGTLWALNERRPLRFRCHTGHAYTAAVLAERQEEAAEDAVWAAVRALQEKEKLYRQFAQSALENDSAGQAHEYVAQADRTLEQALALRSMVLRVGRQPGAGG